jgi:hypothetical protein
MCSTVAINISAYAGFNIHTHYLQRALNANICKWRFWNRVLRALHYNPSGVVHALYVRAAVLLRNLLWPITVIQRFILASENVELWLRNSFHVPLVPVLLTVLNLQSFFVACYSAVRHGVRPGRSRCTQPVSYFVYSPCDLYGLTKSNFGTMVLISMDETWKDVNICNVRGKRGEKSTKIFCLNTKVKCEPGSSVSIVTGYELGDRGSIPDRGRGFSL